MLNFKGIDHINMNVSNLEKSIEFYQDVFGFEVKEKGVSGFYDEEYAIIGKSGLGFLAIYQRENFKAQDNANISHLGFNVENLSGALDYFQSKKIPVHYGGGVEYPKSTSVYIEDPDSYMIEISNKFGGGL